MSSNVMNISSEIGRLKKVLLHRPGKELENLMPAYLERLLFDDIPYLEIAQKEHDAFAEILRNNGAEVFYLVDLVEQSLFDEGVKDQFIEDFVFEAGIKSSRKTEVLKEYFKAYPLREMISKMIEGIRKSEIQSFAKISLTDYLDDEYPFIIDPMPNLYFTRDPFAVIGGGVSIHKMLTITRNRETLFAKYIFANHKDFKDSPHWYDRTEEYPLEGGDILVLNSETVAVGISERTHPNAIEAFAKKLLWEGTGFTKVLAIDIPKFRTFMHLDTVFTMVDKDKFTIHPNIQKAINVFVLQKNEEKQLIIKQECGALEDILKKHLNLDNVTLIKCGGESVVDAAREQWNDGTNTLAIAPGEVLVYSRNYVTNKILVENGLKIHVMPSSELSRGRGGPRCMSMGLVRE